MAVAAAAEPPAQSTPAAASRPVDLSFSRMVEILSNQKESLRRVEVYRTTSASPAPAGSPLLSGKRLRDQQQAQQEEEEDGEEGRHQALRQRTADRRLHPSSPLLSGQGADAAASPLRPAQAAPAAAAASPLRPAQQLTQEPMHLVEDVQGMEVCPLLHFLLTPPSFSTKSTRAAGTGRPGGRGVCHPGGQAPQAGRARQGLWRPAAAATAAAAAARGGSTAAAGGTVRGRGGVGWPVPADLGAGGAGGSGAGKAVQDERLGDHHAPLAGSRAAPASRGDHPAPRAQQGRVGRGGGPGAPCPLPYLQGFPGRGEEGRVA